MCEQCFSQEIYGFETEEQFSALDKLLTQKVVNGQLVAMGPASPKPPVAYDADGCYECQNCSEFWLLSTPDNAWRGFLLPAKTAITYQQKLHRRDRRIRWTGILAIVLLGLIIWRLLK